MTPKDRKYTRDHEWVLIEDGKARIGISDHAQHALGDIVFVELPAVGDGFKPGDSFAVVESVKAASEIYTPVGGEVVEVNEALEAEPERINADPYGAFLAVIAVAELDEAALLDADAYDAFVASEG
ncbi:MAG TPA: glycine cleavage system protein GcvH [Clostridia bacterium]|nr:MAG: Glycine cleavage system H protein [Firmicutes bacterium ADurb.Bin248]HOG00315.1 glycine cleavage system protein GcvH [Clostridia bacterium]HOS19113.1 glycine cleavage system protein GcvH [Clostridia bacterium]HPK16331.1 glycine cleavage system protein GcvH [Clostridia bacterium]